MVKTEALHTLMYRQNMDAHFRIHDDAGTILPSIAPVTRVLRACLGAVTRISCDTTQLTTSGCEPTRGVARPRVGTADSLGWAKMYAA